MPICINTVQFPLPKASRVYAMAKAVGEAVAAWDSSKTVAFIGSGGPQPPARRRTCRLHQQKFDLQFMESLLSNPEWATQFSIHELVEKTGTQGVELLMWLAMRAALTAGESAGVRKSAAITTSLFPIRQRDCWRLKILIAINKIAV